MHITHLHRTKPASPAQEIFDFIQLKVLRAKSFKRPTGDSQHRHSLIHCEHYEEKQKERSINENFSCGYKAH